NRFDEAETAFGEAVHRRPGYVDALRDLAQLIWMRTGDLASAIAPLEAKTIPPADARRARIVKARLFEAAGDPGGGYRALPREDSADPELEITKAQLALGFDPARALDHALRAETLAPNADGIQRGMIDVLLAVGRPEDALAKIKARPAHRTLD